MAPDRSARKRQRTEAIDEDAKKQRGRPRVEGQDETAADRRRTQIRLAQRAYRQRKETTISTLKDQVSTLQATVEEMENTFLAFNDKAVASGLLHVSPELARELKAATEAFIHLAKKTHASDDDISESEPEEVYTKPIGAYQKDITMALGRPNKPTTKLASSSPERSGRRQDVDIGMGYIQVLDDIMSSNPPSEHNTRSFGSPISDHASTNDVSMAVDFTIYPYSTSESNSDLLALAGPQPGYETQAFNVTIPTPPPIPFTDSDRADMLKIKTLAPPYTYSFQESTFARRLQRATLERGYHLISSSDLRPSAFFHVFRLSLLYHTRETLLMKFRRALAKTVEEPLETFQTPFIHLGGAGMHYNTGRVRNGYIVKPGPLDRQAILESVDAPGAVVDIEIDLSEYEGEWFDSNDVEGYLLEKGIEINPQAHFVDAQIAPPNVPMSPPAEIYNSPPSSTSGARTLSDATPEMPVINETTLELGTQRLFPELGNSPSNVWDSNITGWLLGSGDKTPDFLESGWMNVNSNSGWDPTDAVGFDNFEASHLAPPNKKEEELKHVTVDVGKLIDELIKSAICLGRAPGFRKRDVDRALSTSIIQVY